MINLYLHSGSENHGCEAIVRSTVDILGKECCLYSYNVQTDKKYNIDDICTIKADDVVYYKRYSLQWFLSSLQIKLTNKLDLSIRELMKGRIWWYLTVPRCRQYWWKWVLSILTRTMLCWMPVLMRWPRLLPQESCRPYNDWWKVKKGFHYFKYMVQ